MESLDQLKIGQTAIVREFSDEVLSTKLIEMGCLPGETISISKTAPLGCPIAINISGYELCLRKNEAASVLIELLP
jgi:ferrous iron transport protein A